MLTGKVLYDTVVLTTERHEEKLIITNADGVGDTGGQIKDRQTVVLTGEHCKDIQPGDEVLINEALITPDKETGKDRNLIIMEINDVEYLFVPRRYILYVYGKEE